MEEYKIHNLFGPSLWELYTRMQDQGADIYLSTGGILQLPSMEISHR